LNSPDTGVTRGKRLVVLIGQRKALAIAVKGARTRRRWSKLREWLPGRDYVRLLVNDPAADLGISATCPNR
jgi:hypothetical protein